MAQTAILIRHGEVHNPDHVVYADLPGFGLSARGRRQAAATADRLAELPVCAVYASPLQRAVETAEPIAAAHSLALRTDARLTEWELGVRWKGVVWEELDDVFPGELGAYLEHPWDLAFTPEPLDRLAMRVAGAVEELVAAAPDGCVAFVSHQDPIQAARLALADRTLHGLNADKPRHAEAFGLEAGTPWREAWRWAPEEQEGFPPGS